jgi:hypothetical protein
MLCIKCNHARVWVEVLNFLLIGLVPLLVLSISSYAQAQQQMQQPPSIQTQQPQQQYPNQQPYAQQQNPFQQQNPGQLQQSPPQQQQQQPQGQPLYNEPAVIACLNHQLIDSIVKAGTTGALTLHNNTQGATAALNQTFITNATNALDGCIMPMRR